MTQVKASTVRRASGRDAEACVGVVVASITQLCVADHANDPDTLARWLGNKTAASFEQWLENAENFSVVAELGSAVCGVALLHSSGAIRLCYVLPGMQGHGVGRALIERLEQEAQRQHIAQLQLTSTGSARRFYEHLGFVASGEAKTAFGVLKEYPYVKPLPRNAA